ncbi:MAG: S24/S26 family peptidase [Bacillota bacterium]
MTELAPLLLEKLAGGGEVTLTVTGSSMFPLLRHRIDSVVMAKAPSGRLRRYDIALYRRKDGTYILHRIVAVEGDCYLAIGDGQWQGEMVGPDQIIGVVRGIWCSGRYLSCNQLLYRAYAVVWTQLMPLRRYLLAGILGLRRMGKGDGH